MEQIKGFKNSNILIDGKFVKTDLLINNGVIQAVGDLALEGLLELDEGKYLVPGFIDQHVHGADGADVIDGTQAAVGTMAAALAREGTTAFLATTTTHSVEYIDNALAAVKAHIDRSPGEGAMVLGVHLEGPFISRDFLGAQLPEYAVSPSVEAFKHYEAVSGKNIRLVSMAIEDPAAEALVGYLISAGVKVSVGHSAAGYEQVEKAVTAGVSCVTHTYNAQSPVHHRRMGVAGAAMLIDGLYCEAICDGVHLSPPAVKLLHKTKPADKLVLITDALRVKGLADGQYLEPGGQRITLKGKEARLDDGTLAGSVLKMNVAVKNAMDFLGIDLAAAVKLATENPAKCLGEFKRMGSIAPGKLANFAVVDGDVNVFQTIREGKAIYKKQ